MLLPTITEHSNQCVQAKESYRDGEILQDFFIASLCPDCYVDMHLVAGRAATDEDHRIERTIARIYGLWR